MNVAMSKTHHARLIELFEARKPVLLLLLMLFSLRAFAAERVSVAQLTQAVADLHDLPDENAAQRINVLELTERLIRPRYEELKSALPGEKSRQALLAVADSSAFLDLPAGDALGDPAPDQATKGRIVSRAADFVVETISRMPDFLASRTTTRFQNTRTLDQGGTATIVSTESFNFRDKNTDTVTFRNGREITETSGKKRRQSNVTVTTGLANWGIFGPLLGVVMTDLMKGKIGWSHWEKGPNGPLAVFRYVVDKDTSNYTVRYCCFRSEEGEMRQFEEVPAYHGEIAIAPESGAVFRLVLQTDLQALAAEPDDAPPIERLDLVVDYGPVEIGGKTCICPVQSTTISRAEAIVFHGYAFYADKHGKPTGWVGDHLKHAESASLPKVTAINDVVFDDYHQFRGEVRIVPTDNSGPDDVAPPAVPAGKPKPPQSQ
jgi:hypothetical protein